MLVLTDKYKCTSRGIDVTSLVYLKTNAVIDLNLLAPTVRWVWSKPYVLTNICIHELKIVPNMKSLNKSTERFLQEHFPDVSNLLSYSVTKVFVVKVFVVNNGWKQEQLGFFSFQKSINIIVSCIVQCEYHQDNDSHSYLSFHDQTTSISQFKKKTRVILLHMDY